MSSRSSQAAAPAPPPPPRAAPRPRPRHCVALVSDFFYPRLGGVEGHIWSLAQCLLARGHGVVVITGSYWLPDGSRRVGVRHMTGGLRVYYLPLLPVFDQAVFPGYFTGLPLLRAILARERVTLVHGHQTTSVLQHECLLQAQLLGYRTLYTDHSLFGFDDPAALNLSKYVSFPLAAADGAIAVSHTGRANLCARTGLPPERVYAIPNAVDATKFAPAPERRPPPPAVTVVLLSRLVYRKGIDLAVRVIPAAAAARPHVRFVVGGDGPKRLLLEEMRERHGLHERVELLGAVPHAGVRAVLTRGHVFLNCSLTEAFCIAILEAACAGCLVVSTPVGGVPEVLPPGLAILADAPEAGALTAALLAAIDRVDAARRAGGGHSNGSAADGGAPPLGQQQGAGATPASADDDTGTSSATASNIGRRRRGGGDAKAATPAADLDPWAMHAAVAAAYSWPDVAGRTVAVYDAVAASPPLGLDEKFARWARLGPLYGPVACILMALIYLMTLALEVVRPAARIQLAADADANTDVEAEAAPPADGHDSTAAAAAAAGGTATSSVRRRSRRT